MDNDDDFFFEEEDVLFRLLEEGDGLSEEEEVPPLLCVLIFLSGRSSMAGLTPRLLREGDDEELELWAGELWRSRVTDGFVDEVAVLMMEGFTKYFRSGASSGNLIWAKAAMAFAITVSCS